ncbi:hypothetical protein MASR1M74_00570 [Lentimicrobium sp.]
MDVKVIFPFSPSNVVFHGWWPEQTNLMTETGLDEFSFNASTTADGILIFNIRYDLPEFGLTSQWVAAGKKYTDTLIPHRLDAHGLKNAKIYVNNQLINNLHIVRNTPENGCDISIKINEFNNVLPFNDISHPYMTIDDRIPTEVHHHYAYRNLNVPLNEDVNVVGWLIALSDNNHLSPSTVEVDYIKVYGFQGSDSILLCSQEYNSYNPINDGGLYLRYPFFPPGYDIHAPMPANLNSGILSFSPSDNRLAVCHLWSDRYQLISSSQFDNYKVICRVRIDGHATNEAGIDFRDIYENVHEMGVSEWYFHNNGQWQEVIFDSRSFTTSSAPISANQGSVNAFFSAQMNSIVFSYNNLAPGSHVINLFTLEGRLIYSERKNFNTPEGIISIPVGSSFPKSMLYSIAGGSENYNGKIIIP